MSHKPVTQQDTMTVNELLSTGIGISLRLLEELITCKGAEKDWAIRSVQGFCEWMKRGFIVRCDNGCNVSRIVRFCPYCGDELTLIKAADEPAYERSYREVIDREE